jgi:hypothetical protein
MYRKPITRFDRLAGSPYHTKADLVAIVSVSPFSLFPCPTVLFGLPGCTPWSPERLPKFLNLQLSLKQALPYQQRSFKMRFSTFFFTLVTPFLVSAAPARFYGKRAAADVLVFKFADVLEQLETQFYTQALAKFKDADFIAAGFSSSSIPLEQFNVIQSDEQTHSNALQAELQALGEQPISSCKFDFSSVLGDVSTMAATARVVENVGVSAYLGGATLITDPVLLDAAASILTVEARHQTMLNVLSAGTAIPSAFDIPLQPSEVLAIAGPFISGCDVGIPAFPTLTVTNTGAPKPGTQLSFKSAAINGTVSEDKLFCQMMIGGNPFAIVLPFNQCVVPQGINGPVGIWVTNDPQPLINNVRDRATNNLIAGPTMAYIDSQTEILGQLVLSGSNNGSSSANTDNSTTSTQTITPDQASSVIAGASQTSAAGSDGSSATATATNSTNSTNSSTATATDSSAATATNSATASQTSAAGSAGSSAMATATNSTNSSMATATDSSAATATNSATANNASAPSDSGGPNMFTGPSADGSVTVDGWTNI